MGSIDDLRDSGGRSINTSIKVGDAVSTIDGNSTSSWCCAGDKLCAMLIGDAGSCVRLGLISGGDLSQPYTVVLSRHIPIRTWEGMRKSYELQEPHPPFLSVPASFAADLESLRHSIQDPSHEHFVDILSSQCAGGSSLGLTFGIEAKNLQKAMVAGRPARPRDVIEVAAGSPAQYRGVQVGDEVVAIDGVQTNEVNLIPLVRGVAPGTACTLKVMRKGIQFEIVLPRYATSEILSSEEIARQVSGLPEEYRGLRRLLEQRDRGRVRKDVEDANNVKDLFTALMGQILGLEAQLSGPPRPIPSGDEVRD